MPVLILGLFASAVGAMVVVYANRIDGILWLAVPIVLLSLALVAICLRSAYRPSDPSDEVPFPIPTPPGPWYPFALLGIPTLLWVWIIIRKLIG